MRSPVHDVTAGEGEVLSLTRGDWRFISDVIKISRHPDSAGSCMCVCYAFTGPRDNNQRRRSPFTNTWSSTFDIQSDRDAVLSGLS